MTTSGSEAGDYPPAPDAFAAVREQQADRPDTEDVRAEGETDP